MKFSSFFKAVAASALLSVGIQAQADLLLTPATSGMISGSTLTPPTGPSNCEPDCVNLAFPSATSPLDLLYKADVGNEANPATVESGSFSSFYSTTFQNTDLDPSGATITWDGGSFITCPECYLAIKDGNQTPSYYFYNLSGWNGQDTIVMSGFWPNQGAISHVSIWGKPSNPPGQLPEPAAIALLGLGLVGVALARRRRAA